MLEDSVLGMYDEFVLEFFRSIFSMVKERDGSLSAMEAFSVEVIHELREPTIGKFAEFLNISQSNATYKVNNLIKKGYIEKQNSTTDRREYHLVLSEKYYKYTSVMRGASPPSPAALRIALPGRMWTRFPQCCAEYPQISRKNALSSDLSRT